MEIDESDIHAFLDGELAPEREAMVLACLGDGNRSSVKFAQGVAYRLRGFLAFGGRCAASHSSAPAVVAQATA